MDVRIFTEPQQGASYDDLLRVARAAEHLGFDGFFRSDHFLRIGDGDPDPGPTDSWVTLGALARETHLIRLGTLVTSATFRLPGLLAVAVAQVDQMSGGRVELGFGTGWFEGEHTAQGIPFPSLRERFDRFEEQLAILDGWWRTPAGNRFSYDGRYYTVHESPALPKPVQQPRPPIIIGGVGARRTPELAARYGQEYNVAFRSVADTRAAFDRVREAASGRQLVYSVAQTVCVGRDDAELRSRAAAISRVLDAQRAHAMTGTPAEVVDRIGAYAELGATRIYLQLLDLHDLDQLDLIASSVAPQL